MAYLTVTQACAAWKCNECDGTENVPPEMESNSFIAGGGICVCACHKRVSEGLERHVRGEISANEARRFLGMNSIELPEGFIDD